MKSFLSLAAGCDFTKKELRDSLTAYNPIQDGTFRGCSGMGGIQKGPALKSVTHPTMMKLDSYSLAKEDPKICESRDTPLESC